MICKESQKEVQYFGESARTSYDRGLDHQNALLKRDPESPLVEHLTDDHPEIDPSEDARGYFDMKVKSYHARPLQRQCEEAHQIISFKGHKILNRKGEWGQNLPPKLVEDDLEKPQKRKRIPNLTSEAPQNLQTAHNQECGAHDPQDPQDAQHLPANPTKRRKIDAPKIKAPHVKAPEMLKYFKLMDSKKGQLESLVNPANVENSLSQQKEHEI